MTFNGQVYGVPYAVENIALFRNTDLAPDAPATIEELVAAGKALKAAGKATEIMALQVGQNGDAYHIYPLFTSGGGYLFGTTANGDYDPKDLGLGQARGGRGDGQDRRAWARRAQGALKRSIDRRQRRCSLFTGKKTAFLVSGPWASPTSKKAGVKYDISPIPGFAGGKPASRSSACRRSTSRARARTRRSRRSS